MKKLIIMAVIAAVLIVIGYGHIHQCEGVAINVQCAEAQIDRILVWAIGGMISVSLLCSWLVVSAIKKGKFL